MTHLASLMAVMASNGRNGRVLAVIGPLLALVLALFLHCTGTPYILVPALFRHCTGTPYILALALVPALYRHPVYALVLAPILQRFWHRPCPG